MLVSQVKTLIPNARTLVTITHPFGEYHAHGRGGVPPMLYAEMVAQAGINFEAFGLEARDGRAGAGHVHARPVPAQLPARPVLDARPAGVPDRRRRAGAARRADPGDTSDGRLEPAASAGRWHRPVGPAAAGRVDGSGLPAGAEQAVRREHRLGEPGGPAARPCPAAGCSTTCSSPSPASRSSSSCANDSRRRAASSRAAIAEPSCPPARPNHPPTSDGRSPSDAP